MVRLKLCPTVFVVCCLALLVGGAALPGCSQEDGSPPPEVSTQKIATAEAAQVQQVLVKTDAGQIVGENVPLYMSKLSARMQQTVLCEFGLHGIPGKNERVCYPLYPAAISDDVANTFADANCTQQLVFEDEDERNCAGTPLALAVVGSKKLVKCGAESFPGVFEVSRIDKPVNLYTWEDGKCSPSTQTRTNLIFYALGRTLTPDELPRGTRIFQ